VKACRSTDAFLAPHVSSLLAELQTAMWRCCLVPVAALRIVKQRHKAEIHYVIVDGSGISVLNGMQYVYRSGQSC
jgi:hypothetical protein